MFADSFRLVSVHCVAHGLGASFLYKCPAPRGSSLLQHGLVIFCNVYFETGVPTWSLFWDLQLAHIPLQIAVAWGRMHDTVVS